MAYQRSTQDFGYSSSFTLTDEFDPIVEILGPRPVQAFYRLEEAAEKALSKEKKSGHYAMSEYECSVLARYVEILDMIGRSEVWDHRERRYRMTDFAVSARIGILLSDFENSERQRTFLTPSVELLRPLHIRRLEQDQVRLIINYSLFGPKKLTGQGPFDYAQGDQSDQRRVGGMDVR